MGPPMASLAQGSQLLVLFSRSLEFLGFHSSSGGCWFLLYNLNIGLLVANSWRRDFVQIRAMFEYSKWATMRPQAFLLVVCSLDVVGVTISNCAVSSSLRGKICCNAQSEGSAGGELLLSQCRRAARSPPVLAVLCSESWLLGFSDSPFNSVFMLRRSKSAPIEVPTRVPRLHNRCHKLCQASGNPVSWGYAGHYATDFKWLPSELI